MRVEPQELRVDGLTVRFGGVTAVDGVDLRVGPGEIVGLIGPNGAGKSTLIDALSGFVRPSSGTVRLGAHDLTKAPVHQRVAAGLVRSWQSIEAFEDINVRENLQVGSERLTWPERLRDLVWPRGTELNAVGRVAAERFQLSGDLDRRPGELSFSQRRMISTARAVALEPSILMLDEPAAGMSDVRRRELAAAIRALSDEHGMGVVLVDHDMPFVMGLCNRIVVLNHGAKIAEGTPAEVRADPDVIAAYLRGDDDEDEQHEHAGDDTPAGAHGTVQRPARANAECLLEARDLAVGYYGRPVVEGIDLTLGEGEVLALLGANRSGKTTTLMSLAGAQLPISGEVTCFGHRVHESVAPQVLADQGFGFLTEDRAVFRQLTVLENFRVGHCDTRMALDLFPELEPMLKRKVGLLSGGQQQMVGLARALARRPRVMLVDEMSLGLAPQIVRRLMDVLRSSADENGVGVILVEQHVPEALRIADSVCVIAGGRMTLAGRVDAVRDDVESAFLADVLGTTAPA